MYDLLTEDEQSAKAVAFETVNQLRYDLSIFVNSDVGPTEGGSWSFGRSFVLNGLPMPMQLGVCLCLMTTEYEKSGLCFLVQGLLH